MIKISAKLLKAIAAHAAKKDVRFYLKTLLINERHIVATDGCRMAVFAHQCEWAHGETLVPIESVMMSLKFKEKTIIITENTIGQVKFEKVTGTYPHYLRVIPKSDNHMQNVVAVNPDYLCDGAELVKQYLDEFKGLPKANPTFECTAGGAYTWQALDLAVVIMGIRENGQALSAGRFLAD